MFNLLGQKEQTLEYKESVCTNMLSPQPHFYWVLTSISKTNKNSHGQQQPSLRSSPTLKSFQPNFPPLLRLHLLFRARRTCPWFSLLYSACSTHCLSLIQIVTSTNPPPGISRLIAPLLQRSSASTVYVTWLELDAHYFKTKEMPH